MSLSKQKVQMPIVIDCPIEHMGFIEYLENRGEIYKAVRVCRKCFAALGITNPHITGVVESDPDSPGVVRLKVSDWNFDGPVSIITATVQ